MNSKIKNPLIMACIMFGTYAVNTLAVLPIYSALVTNVEYQNSAVTDVLFYVSNYLPAIACFIGLAFIIHSVCTSSFKESVPYTTIYQLAVLFGFGVSFVLDLIESSGLEDELISMLLYILINYVVEIVIMYAVVLISSLARKKAAKPLPLAVLLGAAVVFLKNLIKELYYIITFIAEYGFSDIRPNEWVSMSISLVSVFIIFAAGYLIMRFTVSKLEKSRKN